MYTSRDNGFCVKPLELYMADLAGQGSRLWQLAGAMGTGQLKLVVFDLDFTVWDAGGVWCDCVSPPFHRAGDRVFDANGDEVVIYSDIFKAFDFIDELGVPIATASRTSQPGWARNLLSLHGLADRFRWSEIYPSSKVAHFRELASASQASYSEMLFFDDEKRNIDKAGTLGVHSIHVANGFSWEVFERGLARVGV